MVQVALPSKTFALATCLYATTASAGAPSASSATLNFINKCSFPIELYHSQEGAGAAKIGDIATGTSLEQTVTGPAHMFRHSASTSATLVEVTADSVIWYDLSIIPPMPGNCASYEDCKAGDKTGFNVAISMAPTSHAGEAQCTALSCPEDSKDACADAYQFPSDNTKMRDCPLGTAFDVTFCYEGHDPSQSDQPGQSDYGQTQQSDQVQGEADPMQNGTAQTGPGQTGAEQQEPGTNSTGSPQQQESPANGECPTPTPGPLGTVRSSFVYSGEYAGNYPGTYNRVTDLAQCVKEPVSLTSPVGPMSEPVTYVLRGPMLVHNIAVFTKEDSCSWKRVSSYSQATGTVENLTFMNNKNVDYSGSDSHGPQCYATADGKDKAEEPTVFGGKLDDASEPSKVGGGSSVSTGVEINILTGQKCDGQCLGYAGPNDYQGWNGGKKVFVVQVQMPKGETVDRPALWMLNAQVVHSGQYDTCNCRGMGAVGGCGELDIAEVIETNTEGNKVSCHYYHYDGKYVAPGGDNFADRRYDEPTVYVTIIDDSNDGTVKIVELDTFDFSLTTLDSIYEQLLSC